MTQPKMVPTWPEAAAEAGFPVVVDLPRDRFPDGPLRLTHPAWPAVQNYTVTGGRTEAATRDRLDALVALGATPLIRASEAGDGTPTPG